MVAVAAGGLYCDVLRLCAAAVCGAFAAVIGFVLILFHIHLLCDRDHNIVTTIFYVNIVLFNLYLTVIFMEKVYLN
jgi:hypothetical protein